MTLANYNLPSIHDLRDYFDYSLLTGRLIWRKRSGKRGTPGKPAGYLNKKGYWVVRFKGKNYLHSRMVYYYMTGQYPELSIDHIDRNPSNDCIWNLRTATVEQQIHNRTLTCTGVRKIGDRYQMRIMVYGKRTARYFDTREEAEQAYISAREAHPAAHPETVVKV